ncbi:MAG TPA: alpha/beta fold hydrolase [Candidatus Hydrogenedentes bacterium]|nr:alpha/beta fold hydrolase [Candidatus Hydrogenedentota bacterium]
MMSPAGKTLLVAALLGAVAGAFSAGEEVSAQGVKAGSDTVVLLHGMGRTRASMWLLEVRLRSAGYTVLNFPYSAKATTVDALSGDLRAFIAEKVETPVYHLIGHSLGNIILRDGFKKGYPPGLGRIVMLAPPNRPAEMARAFKDNPIYRWFTGESGQQLASEAFYETLPVPPVEFGIIAGDRGQRLTFREPNDGVVTVESTKLEGMKAWALVHHAHTFIMNSRQVALLCMQFLRHGNFDLPPGLAEDQGEMSGDSHRLTPDDPADD